MQFTFTYIMKITQQNNNIRWYLCTHLIVLTWLKKKKEKTLQSAADSSYNLPKCTALLVYKTAYTIVYNC